MNQIARAVADYIFSYPRFTYASYRISLLTKPIVSMFGGKHISSESPYYQSAFQLSYTLAQYNMSILSGGGPGIMEAAVCGATQINAKNALGIGVHGIDEEHELECKGSMIFVSDFSMRKHFLIYYSQAFVIFPGGIGTVDEFFDVLNLIKVQKLDPAPIILFDKVFWKPLVQLLNYLVDQGLVYPEVLEYIKISDDIPWIVDVLVSRMHRQ